MVTIVLPNNRSTEDDYTPQDQVEKIQEEVISMLDHLYGHNLDIHHHYYNWRPVNGIILSNSVSEPPADICDCTYL